MTEIGMQQIPIADAIKRGLSMPKDAVVDAAKCTESPLWGMTISNHWCGRHPALARDIELRSVRHDMQEAKDYKIASDPPDRALPSGIKFGPD
jgi:hypothetical protein